MFADACRTEFKVNSRRGGRGCIIRWVRPGLEQTHDNQVGIKFQLGQLQKEGREKGREARWEHGGNLGGRSNSADEKGCSA